ncbi:MAG: tetratricopeptide repeat protein [Elusimicrobia bacterium]|nr:tetratricopeptide repeat protein [Elusimicrobiota bacterium]
MRVFVLLIGLAGVTHFSFAQGTQKPQLVQADEDDWVKDIRDSTGKIEDLTQRIDDPSTPPEEKPKYEAAREAEVSNIEQVGQKRPENYKAQMDVGKALVKVNEPARAMPFADQAVALSQGKPKKESAARTLRGTILHGQRDYPSAALECGRAVELDPSNNAAYSCYQLTRDRAATKGAGPAPGGSQAGPAGASAAGERPSIAAAPLGPEHGAVAGLTDGNALKASALAREAAGKLGLGDSEAGRRLIDKAVGLDPDNAKLRVARGQARLAAKDLQGAREDADAAVRLDPMSAAALFLRIRVGAALGWKPELILADMKSAGRLDPGMLPDLRKIAKGLGLGAFEGQDDPGSSGGLDDAAASGRQVAAGVGKNSAAKSILGGHPLSFCRPKNFLEIICAAVLSMIVIVGVWIVWKRKAGE